MRLSVFSAAIVAVLVGFGGTVPVILAAAQASGANAAQSASFLMGLCLAMAASTLVLSLRHRMPTIAAWSTPGAALVASATAIPGIEAAVGAFVLAAGLVVLTATLAPLGRLIDRIPTSVAAAMLSGILLRLVVAMVEQAAVLPALVLPMVGLFLVARLFVPATAALLVLLFGGGLALAMGLVKPIAAAPLVTIPVFVMPACDIATLIGLGLPLYLVTMASQNLPGFAVLRASGYAPPTRSILGVTGVASLATALMGAPTTGLAALTAAISAGQDPHPPPAERWRTGPVYAAAWALFGIFAALLVALFAALPPALLATMAGLALLGPLAGALGTALSVDRERMAPAATLAVTASGVTLAGVGSAFWGLCAGLVVVTLERWMASRTAT